MQGLRRRWPARAVALLACGLVLGAAACGGPEEAAAVLPRLRGDLILVSVDTLRADRLPFYGAARATAGDPQEPWTPAWLAAHGQVWEQAWAPAGKTLPALGTFFTGKHPLEHGAVSNQSRVQSAPLLRRLAADGWEGHAAVANLSLHPASGLGAGFNASYSMHARERAPDPTLEEFNALEHEDEIPASLLSRTAGPVQAGRPLYLWAHFMAPHQPYVPLAEHAGRWTELRQPLGTRDVLGALHRDPARAVPELVEHLRALYDAEIRTASDYVRELLAGLDRQYRDAGRGGLRENATVVFFSDHGEELADRHGYFMHAKSLYGGVIRVPLVILGPEVPAGAREERAIGLGEVLPMLLDGTPPAGGVHCASYHADFYAARDARWTLVHNPAGDPDGPEEVPRGAVYPYPEVALYDRRNDPLEQHDVAAEHPREVRRLLGALQSWYFGLDRSDVLASDTLSPADLDALGYPEGGGGSGEQAVDRVPWSPDDWPR